MIGTEPGLVIGMELLDGEGENAPPFSERDELAVIGNIGGFEGFISGGILPITGRKAGN